MIQRTFHSVYLNGVLALSRKFFQKQLKEKKKKAGWRSETQRTTNLSNILTSRHLLQNNLTIIFFERKRKSRTRKTEKKNEQHILILIIA